MVAQRLAPKINSHTKIMGNPDRAIAYLKFMPASCLSDEQLTGLTTTSSLPQLHGLADSIIHKIVVLRGKSHEKAKKLRAKLEIIRDAIPLDLRGLAPKFLQTPENPKKNEAAEDAKPPAKAAPAGKESAAKPPTAVTPARKTPAKPTADPKLAKPSPEDEAFDEHFGSYVGWDRELLAKLHEDELQKRAIAASTADYANLCITEANDSTGEARAAQT